MAIHFSKVPATFRNIPRVGTTSFKYWVSANIEHKEMVLEDNHPDMVALTSLDDIKLRWPNYGTTFCFVRNPYERLVSIFHFIGQDAKRRMAKRKNNSDFEPLTRHNVDDDVKLFLEYRKGFTHWILNPSAKHNSSVTMMMFSEKQRYTQMHCLNHTVPDIVVKLENINQEFIKIQDLIKCYVPPIHTNASLHTGYRDYYTTETQKIAQRWVEEDLDTFGYTF